jgi:hypothetical protein
VVKDPTREEEGRRSPRSHPRVSLKSSKSGGSLSNGSSGSSSSLSSSFNLNVAGPNLSSKEVAAALVQNINAITVKQVEEKERERKKALMLHVLGSESQKLFILLSTKDWDDKKPKLDIFMRELVSNKRMVQAIKIFQSEMKHWAGIPL